MFRTFIVGMISVTHLTGCGTLHNLENQRTPYGGLVDDVDMAIHGTVYMESIIDQSLAVLDAPFSLVADTVTLPITIVESVKQKNQRRENEWRIAESAYRDEDGLHFRNRLTPDDEN